MALMHEAPEGKEDKYASLLLHNAHLEYTVSLLQEI